MLASIFWVLFALCVLGILVLVKMGMSSGPNGELVADFFRSRAAAVDAVK